MMATGLSQNHWHKIKYARERLVLCRIDQTPTMQLIEPAYDRSTGHAHIGSNLGDRERLAIDIAKRDAQSYVESF